MRPNVSEDLVAQVADRVNERVEIPADSLDFSTQLEVLLEAAQEAEDAKAENRQLRQRITQLQQKLESTQESESSTMDVHQSRSDGPPHSSRSSRSDTGF